MSLRRLLRPLAIAAFAAVAANAHAVAPGLPEDSAESGAPPSEYEVKAAFLYNFALYVRWPEEAFERPDAPLVFAVLGDDPFGQVLDETVADKRAQERTIVIRRFAKLRDVGHCHVLFVPRTEVTDLPRLLELLGAKPVLLVGEEQNFAVRGGAVNFFLEQKRVRFEINPDAARPRELRISSKLLKLAHIVSARRS